MPASCNIQVCQAWVKAQFAPALGNNVTDKFIKAKHSSILSRSATPGLHARRWLKVRPGGAGSAQVIRHVV
eukprot:935236-Amphidinium_carterae.1